MAGSVNKTQYFTLGSQYHDDGRSLKPVYDNVPVNIYSYLGQELGITGLDTVYLSDHPELSREVILNSRKRLYHFDPLGRFIMKSDKVIRNNIEKKVPDDVVRNLLRTFSPYHRVKREHDEFENLAERTLEVGTTPTNYRNSLIQNKSCASFVANGAGLGAILGGLNGGFLGIAEKVLLKKLELEWAHVRGRVFYGAVFGSVFMAVHRSIKCGTKEYNSYS